tara:strand:- start:1663 stop:1854 length:192 start_codon:yes stop_codon:yes gene_type:complete
MDNILHWRKVCEELSISRSTLIELTQQGILKPVGISKGKTGGSNRVGWLQSEVDRYKTTHKSL